jgi:hypothetical protein
MRNQLAIINGSRTRFEGIFVRFGSKTAYKGYPIPTVLLKDIRSLADDNIRTEHLWFTCGKQLDKLNLKENDIVRFDARVTTYEKGYKGHRDIEEYKPIELDYRLSFPTKVVKVEHNNDTPKLI